MKPSTSSATRSAKKKVQFEYPNTFCRKSKRMFHVYLTNYPQAPQIIGWAHSPASAWEDALRRMPK